VKVSGDGGDGPMTDSNRTAELSVDEQRQMNVYELSHVGRDCQLTLKLTGHLLTLALSVSQSKQIYVEPCVTSGVRWQCLGGLSK